MNLKNCENCGAVFADPVRSICRDCYYKEEDAFQIVYDFLRDRRNREATIDEIAVATKVDKELIVKFIKQKRLRTSQFPKLAYPCENCGVDIVEGRLCVNCAEQLKSEVSLHRHADKLEAERKKREETVYYTINKKKDRS